MPQFGSETTIGPRIRAVICDCFETLVRLDGRRYQARQGVEAFLRYQGTVQGRTLAVCSDGPDAVVRQALAEAGLSVFFTQIFTGPDAVETLTGGKLRKRLDVVLHRLGVDRADAVFIGDSPLDAEAAQHHQVPFVRVPRSEDTEFSFTRLIGGPSRYVSGEFHPVFMRSFGQKPPPPGADASDHNAPPAP